MRKGEFVVRGRGRVVILLLWTVLLPAWRSAGVAAAGAAEKRFDAVAYAAYASGWMQIHRALTLEQVDAEEALACWRRAEGFMSFALERDPEERLIGRPLLACEARLGATEKLVELLKRFPEGRIEPDGGEGINLILKAPDSDAVLRAYETAAGDKALSAAKRSRLLREAGDYALLSRHYSKALSFYDHAADADPADAELAERVMRLYTAIGGLERALTVGRRFVETSKSFDDEMSRRIADRLGMLYGRMGRAGEGAEVFGKLYRGAPDNPSICESYMVLLQGAGRLEELDKVAAAFFRRNDTLSARLVYAGLLAESGKGAKAAEVLEALFKRRDLAENKPAFLVGTVMAAARSLAGDGAAGRAVRLVESLLALPEKTMEPLLRTGICIDLARLYVQAKAPDRAREILNDVLDKRPTTTEAWVLLAEIDREAGRREEALATLRRGLEKNPKGPVALRLRAKLAYFMERDGDFESAVSLLRENLAEDPRDAESCNNLGYLYASRGMNLDEALQLIEIAVKSEPGNWAYLDSHGWAKYRIALRDNNLEMLKAGAAALERARQLASKDAVVHDHAGDALYVLGRWEDAVKCWRAALELAGDDVSRLPDMERVKNKAQAVSEQIKREPRRERKRPIARPLKPPPFSR